MKNKRIKAIIISFLLMFLLSLQVSAAEDPVTREQTFTTDTKTEENYEKQIKFDKEIREDGKNYRLKNIKYKITDTKYVDKKEKIVESKDILQNTIMEDGQEYTLIKLEESEKQLSPETEKLITSYTDYNYPVTEADIPHTKNVVTTDSSGEQQNIMCKFSNLTYMGNTVQENEIAITFEDYDAAYYEWNGIIISKNDEVPALYGYEEEILEGVGAVGRITSIYWAGEPYAGTDGILYRDAIALVRQEVPSYRANYEGTVKTEAEVEKIYKGTYEGADLDGRAEYTVLATAEYEEIKNIIPYIAVGIGIVVLAAAFITILFILSKKKKKQDA